MGGYSKDTKYIALLYEGGEVECKNIDEVFLAMEQAVVQEIYDIEDAVRKIYSRTDDYCEAVLKIRRKKLYE